MRTTFGIVASLLLALPAFPGDTVVRSSTATTEVLEVLGEMETLYVTSDIPIDEAASVEDDEAIDEILDAASQAESDAGADAGSEASVDTSQESAPD